eukprot:scaffold22742_cov139-Cylindrotheca_fusiformis.AAC.15
MLHQLSGGRHVWHSAFLEGFSAFSVLGSILLNDQTKERVFWSQGIRRPHSMRLKEPFRNMNVKVVTPSGNH